MHQPVTVSSNMCSQMRVQLKQSPTHLKDSFLTLAGVIKPGAGWCAPGFLELLLSANVCMRACVCVRPRGY